VLDDVAQLRVRRLFIDGLEGLTLSIAFGDRVPAALAAFANELRVRGVTTILSIESPVLHFESPPLGPESAFVENLILLRYVQRRARSKRLLSLVKVRGSGFDSAAREFRIGAAGIEVERSPESAEAILTDMATSSATTDLTDPPAGPPGGATRRERR
jgi:circadian clock protein KaiC